MQRLILLFGVGTLITACAHDHLAERNIANEPGELIVKIGSKEVKAGDKIAAYKIECYYHDLPRRGRTKECRHTEVGKAVVVEVLGPEQARVKGAYDLLITDDMHFEKSDH